MLFDWKNNKPKNPSHWGTSNSDDISVEGYSPAEQMAWTALRRAGTLVDPTADYDGLVSRRDDWGSLFRRAGTIAKTKLYFANQGVETVPQSFDATRVPTQDLRTANTESAPFMTGARTVQKAKGPNPIGKILTKVGKVAPGTGGQPATGNVGTVLVLFFVLIFLLIMVSGVTYNTSKGPVSTTRFKLAGLVFQNKAVMA